MEKVFEDIVYIMNHDYAGWEDKRGCDNPENFLQKIRKEKQLSKEVFKEIVEDYLLDFNDQHIFFNISDSQAEEAKVRGFRVRRFEERLYVTDVDSEKRLKPGMYFVSLGGYSIAELRGKHHRLLNENHAEREDWTPILSIYEKGEVKNSEGILTVISFAYYDKSPYTPTYSIQQLPENTALITMMDFADPDAIMKMITENLAILESAEKWVIDVRVNYGGSDSSYFPLLPYLMPKEGAELADKDEKQYFNCTVANEKRIQSELVEQLETTRDEQAKHFLGIFQREWKKNKGKGFVEFDFSEVMPDTFIEGKELPKSVVVLTDVRCGSSGDSFVEYCKKSSKVIVIGRATMGLNDYANLTSKIWDEGFEFTFPTSRLSRIDKGQGMTGVGIEPHLHIPWTPNHLEVDVDMDRALKILSLTSSPMRN